MAKWKCSFQPLRKKKRSQKLEQESDQRLELSEVTAIVEHEPMWVEFDATVDSIKTKGSPRNPELTACTSALVAAKAGAVTNVSLNEYGKSKIEDGHRIINRLYAGVPFDR